MTNKNSMYIDKLQHSLKIEVIHDVNDKTKERMQDDLVAYEANQGIDVNYRRFSVVRTSTDNIVIGVINAYTAFAEIYIDDIWVERDSK